MMARILMKAGLQARAASSPWRFASPILIAGCGLAASLLALGACSGDNNVTALQIQPRLSIEADTGRCGNYFETCRPPDAGELQALEEQVNIMRTCVLDGLCPYECWTVAADFEARFSRAYVSDDLNPPKAGSYNRLTGNMVFASRLFGQPTSLRITMGHETYHYENPSGLGQPGDEDRAESLGETCARTPL